MELICGHIRIEAHAGSGGFGDVYRGYDERMERNVAIKIVDGIGKSECDMLKRLDHKGLPRLYDIVRDNDKTMMIMEWIEGVNLEQYIEDNGAMSERMAVTIGEELLDILDYLHNMKPAIVYQDLKPANIMLMPNGHVKLVDFGTAVLMNYGDDSKRLAGTYGYGSPEQRGLNRIRHVSTRSDIYSWGAVIYTLLSGHLLSKPPYTMAKIRYVAPSVSFGLAKVITKATRRNEEDRYSNVREVKEAIKAGSFTDILYRFLFTCFGIITIAPFLGAWYMGWRGNLFSMWQNLDINDHVLKQTGILLVTFSWMAFGLHWIQKRKYLKINKSIYLSERKHQGLWISAMLVAFACRYIVASAYEEEVVLPISVCDSNGNHVLVDYGARYAPDGELKLCISEDVLGDTTNTEVTVILIDKDTGIEKKRTIELE